MEWEEIGAESGLNQQGYEIRRDLFLQKRNTIWKKKNTEEASRHTLMLQWENDGKRINESGLSLLTGRQQTISINKSEE